MEKLFFAYRLGDDKTEYVNTVVNTLREQMETETEVQVFLAFVKGIGASYAKSVAVAIASEIEKVFDADSVARIQHITPYVDISIETIRHLERKTSRKGEKYERHKTSVRCGD